MYNNSMSKKSTLLLIDSYALIYRAYYAFPKSLTTSDGLPINAAYGFMSLLLDVILKFKPSHVVALMDSEGPTIRSGEFTEYKANRKAADDEFVIQIPRVEELLNTLDIPILKVSGYEADDIIATIDKSHSGEWAQTIIVTGDRDLFQLVDEDTFVYLAGSSFSQSKLYNVDMVKEKMGVTPEQIADFKGISGDASDNIPGVRGIGPKGAIDLITKYGSIENIFKNINEVDKRYKTKLEESYEIALLSKKLATVDREVPLNFKLEQANFPTLKYSEVENIFNRLKFKSLMSKLSKLRDAYPELASNMLLIEEDSSDNEAKIKEVEGFVELKELPTDISRDEAFLYIEYSESLNCLAISFLKGIILFENSYYILNSDDIKTVVNLIKNKRVYLYNLKKFYHLVRNLNLEFNINNVCDLGSAILLHSGGRVSYDFKEQLYFFNEYSRDIDLLSGVYFIKENSKTLNEFIKESKLLKLEDELQIRVAEMERNGVKLDPNKTKIELEKINNQLQKLISDIYSEAGHEFNINSPKQLSDLLFKERGLTSVKKTKSGQASTNEASLKLLQGTDKLIDLILSYRELEKLRSTYLSKLCDYIDPKTQRIHSTMDQFGAISGRFSSKNPNMQNIPKGEASGFNIRNLFVSEDSNVLVGFDYSQQELRILASLAQEEEMLKSFEQDRDIHKKTASEIFQVSENEVTSFQRDVGKTINFSVIYGISAFALAERLKVPFAEAKSFIDSYYLNYPNVAKFLKTSIENARITNFTETVLGRKRYDPNINSSNRGLRSASERELFNFIIQGSAADIMKKCMIEFDDILKEFNAKLILQVHDEFLFEISEESNLEKFIKSIYYVMEGVYDLGVKYKIEVKYGKTWGGMKEYTL